eukprot:7208710-Prymnesium_polylepis.1
MAMQMIPSALVRVITAKTNTSSHQRHCLKSAASPFAGSVSSDTGPQTGRAAVETGTGADGRLDVLGRVGETGVAGVA